MALSAVCLLVGNLLGTIYLSQMGEHEPLNINGSISKLTPGLHGFHIHEFGDLRNNCSAAGAHFNPFGKEHGGPNDENRHVGDFGNIHANNDGEASFDMNSSLASLYGEQSIVGRAFVIHSGQDDLGQGGNEESKKTGNAGSRVDCCVIGFSKPPA